MSSCHKLENTLVDKVVQLCLVAFNKLPKTGKPIDSEWTVLSCVVQYDKDHDKLEVVSLGTGSKCIGATKMSQLGDILNDSHAEVFARRGFLLYLYDNIIKVIENKPSIFIKQNGRFCVKDTLEFIFYSSQLPCGDASIIPKCKDVEDFGDVLNKKRLATDHICDIQNKKSKLEDIHRTGAKCLSNAEQDLKLPGIDYHLLGQVRTKPGRGDRTLSVSCSDKIAKWVQLGIQGSLLHLLCGTIHIAHFIFGAGVPYSDESLIRAILHRTAECCDTIAKVPKFYQSSLIFPYIKSKDRLRPCPTSIVWINTTNRNLEVAVQGKQLGVTKKKLKMPTSSLNISKYNLYKRFRNILQIDDDIRQRIIGVEDVTKIPYNKMKRKSKDYYDNWSTVKEKFFKIWTVKPDMWNFYVID